MRKYTHIKYTSWNKITWQKRQENVHIDSINLFNTPDPLTIKVMHTYILNNNTRSQIL